MSPVYYFKLTYMHPNITGRSFGEIIGIGNNNLFLKYLSAKKLRGCSFEISCLPLLWWYPAGKFSGDSLDWHYLFCGTYPDPKKE